MNTEQDNKDYLRITDLADLLGLDPKTVYRLVRRGEIPATRIGKLYFIKRTDIDAMFTQNILSKQEKTAAASPSQEHVTCGFCLRILADENEVADICDQPDCDEALCTTCFADGIRTCEKHMPSRSQKLATARQALERGEIKVLVSALDARRMEKNYLARLQTRIQAVNTLLHPMTGKILSIPAWASPVQSDQRARVMELMGTFFLDEETTGRIPLNADLVMRVQAKPNPGTLPVEIRALVRSRLEPMVADGFDIQPLGADELSHLLIDLSETAQAGKVAMLAVIAAPTGWDAAARKIILGDQPGSAYADTHVRYYLFDMQSNDLIFNPQDRLSSGFAELFRPQLLGEQLKEVTQAVEKELRLYDNLSLDLAVQTLPFPKDLLTAAFEWLEKEGRYTLENISGIGLTLIKK